MRSVMQAGATAAAAYLAARVAEEQLNLGRIDCALGLRDVMDGEEMFWRTQHPDGQALPSVRTVLRENAASSQERVADVLVTSVAEHREFSISVQPSQVPGGGLGAHVLGRAPRGAVLSFCTLLVCSNCGSVLASAAAMWHRSRDPAAAHRPGAGAQPILWPPRADAELVRVQARPLGLVHHRRAAVSRGAGKPASRAHEPRSTWRYCARYCGSSRCS